MVSSWGVESIDNDDDFNKFSKNFIIESLLDLQEITSCAIEEDNEPPPKWKEIMTQDEIDDWKKIIEFLGANVMATMAESDEEKKNLKILIGKCMWNDFLIHNALVLVNRLMDNDSKQ